MKFGVLTFGYDGFLAFREKLKEDGYYDVNLGDNAQSIAIRHVYKLFGIESDQVIEINRDMLPHYDGEPVILIMNGVFFRDSFPLPDAIIPIFIGFHAPRQVIEEQVDLLRRYEPIGCRDEGTATLIRGFGIEAFTTGCLTLTLPRRTSEPKSPKLLIVYGSGAGYLPPILFRHVPEHLLADAVFIYHRFHASKFPFDSELRAEAERYESSLLAQYCRDATLILTSLHHVATPCMAFGIPVVICRAQNDIRFSMIEKLVPIYTPDVFDTIDWNPSTADISSVREELLRLVGNKIIAAMHGDTDAA